MMLNIIADDAACFEFVVCIAVYRIRLQRVFVIKNGICRVCVAESRLKAFILLQKFLSLSHHVTV